MSCPRQLYRSSSSVASSSCRSVRASARGQTRAPVRRARYPSAGDALEGVISSSDPRGRRAFEFVPREQDEAIDGPPPSPPRETELGGVHERGNALPVIVEADQCHSNQRVGPVVGGGEPTSSLRARARSAAAELSPRPRRHCSTRAVNRSIPISCSPAGRSGLSATVEQPRQRSSTVWSLRSYRSPPKPPTVCIHRVPGSSRYAAPPQRGLWTRILFRPFPSSSHSHQLP